MSRLSRVFQNLFGLNGSQSNYGQFGSKAAGSPLTSFNPTVIQALTAFTQDGWLDAVNSGNLAPFLEDMNGLHFLIFYQLCYLFQQGIPEWDPTTPYYTNSIVMLAGTTNMYASLTNNKRWESSDERSIQRLLELFELAFRSNRHSDALGWDSQAVVSCASWIHAV